MCCEWILKTFYLSTWVLDPDPHCLKTLDPDSHKTSVDPKTDALYGRYYFTALRTKNCRLFGPLHDYGLVLLRRFACRILCSREGPDYSARIFAAGFDSSRNIFLGEKATKWETEHQVREFMANFPCKQGCGSGPFWEDPEPDQENFHRIRIRILSVLWRCKVE